MRGSDDRTPLDLARRDEHGDLVQLLLLQADPSQVLQLNGGKGGDVHEDDR